MIKMAMLEDKVAVVTGAALGIGRGVARTFVEEGAHVAVVDIDGPAAAEVADELRNRDPTSMALQCDVGDRKQIDICVDAIVEQFGHIEIRRGE
jgi:NAD(P)-dependent dehydrogenase (short-subunit alcohol dehydrogenase family)